MLLLLLPGVPSLAERRLAGVTPEQNVRAMIRMCFGEPDRVPRKRVEQAVQEMRERAEQPWADRALTRSMRGGNDAYNERQVAKRAGVPPAELLAEFERNRAATLAAVEAADEALFAREIRSAGGVVGPLALVFHRVAVEHVLGHARDIAA